jgi:hypothetical protein
MHMDTLYIEGTDETPRIMLDSRNGVFEISGRSLPEDAAEFYQPIFDWLRKYLEHPNQETNFVFKLDYFNTASSKFIQDILAFLESGKGVRITWCFQEDDEDLEESGRNFSELVELPFEFVSYP